MDTMKRILLTTLLASTFVAAATAGPLVVELPATTLTIGKQKVIAEVAATAEQRTTGLMYRFSLKPDHGMIFVFDSAEPQGFWMKNTYIPLSIAFIGSDGRILNIADMAPQDERTHWSNGPAQYALEMRKGWFASHGVAPGDPVTGLPAIKR
jgi:uncharacterized membrane protein (UPF0127 family)